MASRGHVLKDRIAMLRQSARDTIALTQATPERRLEITHLLTRWALVREQLAEVEARIAVLVEQCPEAKILLSVPEISSACAATIVAELSGSEPPPPLDPVLRAVLWTGEEPRYLQGWPGGGHGEDSIFARERPWPEVEGKIVGRYLTSYLAEADGTAIMS